MDTLYDEPAFYRMLFRERARDIGFYRAACAGARRVLELGAGEGRVTLALAEAGHEVVAVERSAAMLEGLARRCAEADASVVARVEALEADARTLRRGERFERVILPFNGLAHFHSDADVEALLATVHHHLAPDGRFVLDALVPDPGLTDGAVSVPRLEHPRTGAICRLEERYRWQPPILTVTTELVERASGRTQTLTLSLRQRDEAEVRALLSAGGLEVTEREDLGDATAFVCAG